MAQQAIKIKRLINQNMLGQELAKTLKNSHVEQEGSIQLSPTMLFGLDTLIDTDTRVISIILILKWRIAKAKNR